MTGSPSWWTVGGPSAMVISMLLLGAVLHSPADGGQAMISVTPDRHRQPIDFQAVADEDAAQLAEGPDGWTLQFLVACELQTLEPIVDALEDQPNFFLLRHSLNGRECYRVCWGRFASRSEAERPRAYPDVLRDSGSIPLARPVADILP